MGGLRVEGEQVGPLDMCSLTLFCTGIFLWLPVRTEDRSGIVGKIIAFWLRIGSRVFERGGNDGFGGFLRLNSILEKNNKTGFRDRWDRSLQTERTAPLQYTLLHLPPKPTFARSLQHARHHTPCTNHTHIHRLCFPCPLGCFNDA